MSNQLLSPTSLLTLSLLFAISITQVFYPQLAQVEGKGRPGMSTFQR